MVIPRKKKHVFDVLYFIVAVIQSRKVWKDGFCIRMVQYRFYFVAFLLNYDEMSRL